MSWLADGVRIRSYWQEYKMNVMAKDSGGIGLQYRGILPGRYDICIRINLKTTWIGLHDSAASVYWLDGSES